MTCMKGLGSFVTEGHRVTVISLSRYHYYSGMGPGLLAGTYRSQETRFHIKKMVEERGGYFVQGAVIRVDPGGRTLFLDSGEQIKYDAVSFNTGSSVPVERVAIDRGANVFTVKPIENLVKAQGLILDLIKTGDPRILVAGGGPAGVEIAGNVWRLVQDNGARPRITLLAGTKLLSGFPRRVPQLVRGSFKTRGIEVVEGSRVGRVEAGRAVLEDNREFAHDVVFLALGVRPSGLFRDSGLPTGEDGGLLVNTYLQSTAHPEIFGGGDCISLQGRPLAKVGVFAVRENPILYHNLMAVLEGGQLKAFDPGGIYLLIYNLGDGKGIFQRRNWVFDGGVAFRLKDHIDRKFMRRFQVSGELEET